MKNLLFLMCMVPLLFSSCGSKDDNGTSADKQKASMTIKIVGDNKGSKAIGTPTQADENEINGYYVYVFENDVLEKVTPLITSGLTYTLQGLTTGTKRVVVVANPLAGTPQFYVGDSFTRFSNAAFNINLDDQVDLTNGLVMTGSVNATLAAAPALNPVEIPVNRVVAKINLGTITLDPVVGVDPGLFTLESVLIMDTPSISSLGLPTIVTTAPLYGGLPGTLVTAPYVRTYLLESITLAAHDNRFFYVFADNATMITLVGYYNGVRAYFPFVIDPIQRNTQHTINMTLRRLGSGSPSPDIPSDPTTMDVTVVPQDWVVMPSQNVTW